jgi:toxin-antitoxin system PIN domain toxin
MTHTAVLTRPMDAEQAVRILESWYEHTHVQVLDPGPRHLVLLRSLFRAAGVAANLTTDAHLAALAIEHGCELHSNDADFGRFSGLRWVNPIG